MTKLSIKFRLHSMLDFSNPILAKDVLKYLLALPEFFRPLKYGTYEPLKSRFSGGSIQPLVNGWLGIDDPSIHDGFRNIILFMDTRSGGSYMVGWGRQNLATLSGRFSFPLADSDELSRRFLEIVDGLSVLLMPQYGHIQDPTSRGGKIPYDLAVRLPDIPPVSIMGARYIDFFGGETLKCAPYLRVSERSYGLWLEASDSLHDEVPEARRTAIRQSLGEDCFMAIPRKRYKKGRAPSFS